MSKLGNKTAWYFFTVQSSLRGHPQLGEDFKIANTLTLGSVVYYDHVVRDSARLTYNEAFGVESKIDDGKADTGIARVVSAKNGNLKFGPDDGTRDMTIYFKMDF